MANLLISTWKGLADSAYSAQKGQLAKAVGVSLHRKPGLIVVNQKLTAESTGTVPDELCKVVVKTSGGRKYWFSSSSGKIWEDNGGTWTLAHTTTPAAGGAACTGAAEYNAFLYWATESRLHRIAISGLSDWAANAVEDWQTFSKTDDSYHPMKVQNQTLFIADGNLVASVDSSATFTASALDIIAPHRIKTIEPFDIDLVLGTIITNTVNHCLIIRWDTVQTTWQFSEPVRENGINAFLWLGNALLAQAGTSGKFYFYDGQSLQEYKRIPGTWSPTQYGEVYPQAVGVFEGIPVFGLSNSTDAANSTGNPADQGVYTIGRYSKDYPIVINGPEYVISQDDVTAVEIGAILVEGNDMYVSWGDGSSYGVDKTDTSTKYASAYIEFPAFTADPDRFITWIRTVISYASLPASTSFTFLYKKNNGSSVTIASGQAADDTNSATYYAEESVDARSYQPRINFNVSGNNAPEIEMVLFKTAP